MADSYASWPWDAITEGGPSPGSYHSCLEVDPGEQGDFLGKYCLVMPILIPRLSAGKGGVANDTLEDREVPTLLEPGVPTLEPGVPTLEPGSGDSRGLLPVLLPPYSDVALSSPLIQV